MRKIRDVLRLRFAAALSGRAIARSLRVSPSTVEDYVRRAEVAGLGWPVPESVDDAALERRLFPTPPPSGTSRPLPAWSDVRLFAFHLPDVLLHDRRCWRRHGATA